MDLVPTLLGLVLGLWGRLGLSGRTFGPSWLQQVWGRLGWWGALVVLFLTRVEVKLLELYEVLWEAM